MKKSYMINKKYVKIYQNRVENKLLRPSRREVVTWARVTRIFVFAFRYLIKEEYKSSFF